MAETKIFFNSSMPRSGSTLMQNILGNNPDFYATPTSGLIDLLNISRKVYTQAPSFKAQNEYKMKKAFLTYCRYAIQGYFEGLTDRKYAIDKSRGWAVNTPFLEAFYPNPKIICMVRDLRDIVASMERNYRKYPERWDASLEDDPKGTTIGERVTGWMMPNSKPVGSTLNQLREVIHRGFDKNILFVRFEDLCVNPKAEMQRVYEYLEVPYYQHDFNNIQQVTFEDDKFHGRYGDHKIHNAVKPVESYAKDLLGEGICKLLVEKNKWYFDYFKYV